MTNSPTASPGKSPSSPSRFQEMTSGAFKHGRSTFNSSNPNSSWLFVKGFICWYIFIIASIHILMLALPFKGLTVPWIWTLTSLIHAVVSATRTATHTQSTQHSAFPWCHCSSVIVLSRHSPSAELLFLLFLTFNFPVPFPFQFPFPAASKWQSTFILFHFVKGAPFPTIDSQNRFQTQWEQLDEEEGYQYNRKALNTIPVLLYVRPTSRLATNQRHPCPSSLAFECSASSWLMLPVCVSRVSRVSRVSLCWEDTKSITRLYALLHFLFWQ